MGKLIKFPLNNDVDREHIKFHPIWSSFEVVFIKNQLNWTRPSLRPLMSTLDLDLEIENPLRGMLIKAQEAAVKTL